MRKLTVSRLEPSRDTVKVESMLPRQPIMEGKEENLHCRYPTLRYTPHCLLLDSLDIRCLFSSAMWLAGCHNDVDGSQRSSHRSMMWFLQIAQLSTTMSGGQRGLSIVCTVYIGPSTAGGA